MVLVNKADIIAPELRAQVVGSFADILSVYENAPRCRLVQQAGNLQQCRFARPALSDQCRNFPRADG